MSQLLLFNDETQSGSAIFPFCRKYRYILWRRWAVDCNANYAMFVGLNPSTADETDDDPKFVVVSDLLRAGATQGFAWRICLRIGQQTRKICLSQLAQSEWRTISIYWNMQKMQESLLPHGGITALTTVGTFKLKK